MERKHSGRLPTSASTYIKSPDPVSSPGSSSVEPWTNLYECAWFRSLVWLIYSMSLATAAIVLYVFPYQGDAYNLKAEIGFFFGFFSAWFGVDLVLLLLFTITSLSLCHAQDTSEVRWTWRANMLPKRTSPFQRILLIVSVLVLTGSSGIFGWVYYVHE